MSESPGHDYLRNHQITGEVLRLDIEPESSAILEDARRAGTGHAAKTLVKDGPLRLVILGFTAGSALREHDSDGPVSIQALSGGVDVAIEERSERLEPGRILVINASISHSVVAQGDAVLLLTIARANSTT
jgi:quercetin dioxygenase-like cupin family protein